MSDDAWAELIEGWRFARDVELEQLEAINEKAFTKSLVNVLGQLFKKSR